MSKLIKCTVCQIKLDEQEIIWADKNGVLNTDTGLPWCDECLPIESKTKQSFTPAPWEVVYKNDKYSKNELLIVGKDQGGLCEVICGTILEEANARLIAKAPEMYEEIRKVLDYAQTWIERCDNSSTIGEICSMVDGLETIIKEIEQ